MITPTLTNVTAQVTALQTAIDNVSPLKDASFSDLAPVVQQAQAAVAAIDAAIAETDAALVAGQANGFAGVVGGGFAPTMATALIDQGVTLQNMATLLTLKGAIGRVLYNLTQATG